MALSYSSLQSPLVPSSTSLSSQSSSISEISSDNSSQMIKDYHPKRSTNTLKTKPKLVNTVSVYYLNASEQNDSFDKPNESIESACSVASNKDKSSTWANCDSTIQQNEDNSINLKNSIRKLIKSNLDKMNSCNSNSCSDLPTGEFSNPKNWAFGEDFVLDLLELVFSAHYKSIYYYRY
jgi:hypothetical protein